MQFSAVIVLVALSAFATAHPAGLAPIEKRTPQSFVQGSENNGQSSNEAAGIYGQQHQIDSDSYKSISTPTFSEVDGQSYHEKDSTTAGYYNNNNAAFSSITGATSDGLDSLLGSDNIGGLL
ncbi:hypothetical protein CROQUDRAFT_716266 [Cronartium quercuum f. sp. fusiforme G11]|uniref:Uncharacterized protein n=1 Tax=Cronartium quercuum f. sp. fusiforme G11 TaxID=708437 RepID=A0A9P6TAF4_9BASI|nr:hypothetical protein CROQUDRAFT_716266 [Cronartium quercuum f. sp. fusiforme G11]